jgi:hypothetical protein
MTVSNFEIVITCQIGVMCTTYGTAVRGDAEFRTDMGSDVKTETACQDVSCKKN